MSDHRIVVINRQTGCLAQFLYFIFIGWWVGAFTVLAAYLLFITVIGIPAGVYLLNRVPYFMALRNTEPNITWFGVEVRQRNILVRALWFFLVGWWFTAAWLVLAYLISCTIIGMPLGFWMFDRTPALLTLHKRS